MKTKTHFFDKTFVKIFNRFLATIGILLGFSKAVWAQYMAIQNYNYLNENDSLTEMVVEPANYYLIEDEENFCREIINDSNNSAIRSDEIIISDEIISKYEQLPPPTNENNSSPTDIISNVQIFPNPNDGNFAITFFMKETNSVGINILQSDCRIISQNEIPNCNGETSVEINITDYQQATYYVQIIAGNETHSYKTIKAE